MSKDIGRRQAASQQKIQDAANAQDMPDSPGGPRFRKSPIGQRLAALRKKKMGGE